MSQERESHNGFEKSATFYLEAAHTALICGKPRLAIHLYRAAFEVESTFGTVISNPIIEGLRKAWDLACDLGDRSTAESIFSDLSAYNNLEQNEKAGLRLQALAMNQLEDMGITEGDLESIAGAISHDLVNSDQEALLDSLRTMLEQLGMASLENETGNTQAIQKLPPFLPAIFKSGQPGPDPAESSESDHTSDATPSPKSGSAADSVANSTPDPTLVSSSDSTTGPTSKSAPSFGQIVPAQNGLSRIGKQLREFHDRRSEATSERQLNYKTLSGYQHTIEHMREYGFLTHTDEHHKSFVEQAAAMHGVPKLSLDGTFLFVGTSREDTSLFAHATAGEIGYPVIHVSIDLDSHGNGSIKLSGPFKRGFFGGPPEIIDMTTPSIILIENIDYLQEMFNNEQMAIQRNEGRPKGMMGGQGRSMQLEVSGYLRALRQRPGMITMATAQSTKPLKEPLRGLLEPINTIEVLPPTQEERNDILSAFAVEHPSFAELDVKKVVYFSEGMSRNELVMAALAAVEQAYRESLRSGAYNRVTLGDVLVRLASIIDHNSPLYRQIEDEAVSQFSFDLQDDMPQQ